MIPTIRIITAKYTLDADFENIPLMAREIEMRNSMNGNHNSFEMFISG